MKPAPFDYERVTDVWDAVEVLGHREDSKVLAGGQSLVPMLNLRLARPTCLVDIAGLALHDIVVNDHTLRIDALVTHRQLESEAVVRREAPLLAKCAPHIGHRAIRQRGTVGGSIAHADPAAELAVATLALDATLVVQGPAGERRVNATDFFHGAFSTDLDIDELLTHVEVPRYVADTRHGFAEVSRRSGDFALVAAACVLPPPSSSASARVAVAGASSSAPLVSDVDWRLGGDAQTSLEVAREVVAGLDVEVAADELAYRRQALVAVVADALEDAGRAEQGVDV